MNNDIAIRTSFSLAPQNMTEAMEMAKLMADSDLMPKDYKGKPANVLVAVQMGSEIGLGPMASVQNIAVMNGKPSLYGDAGKALLLSQGCIIEEDDIAVVKTHGRGRCKITRPGRPPVERTFSLENAKTAGLLGKEGPWRTYPERQLAWRAFWYAARDAAADILRGLSGAEEIRDIQPEKDMGAAQVVETPTYPQDKFDANLPKWTELIQSGKKTAARLTEWIASKGAPLTEAQAKTLADINVPEATVLATAEQVAQVRMAADDATLSENDICKQFGLEKLEPLDAALLEPIMAFIANPTGE